MSLLDVDGLEMSALGIKGLEVSILVVTILELIVCSWCWWPSGVFSQLKSMCLKCLFLMLMTVVPFESIPPTDLRACACMFVYCQLLNIVNNFHLAWKFLKICFYGLLLFLNVLRAVIQNILRKSACRELPSGDMLPE